MASVKLKTGQVPTPELDQVVFDLSCGAKLLVSPRPGAPMTALQVHIRGGHSLDAPDLGGVAWMAGRMVDQGTKLHTADEIVDELEPLGGGINGDSTGLSGTIVSKHWKKLCMRATEMLTMPSYPKDRFELQRGRVLDRLSIERDDPRSQAMHGFRELIYGDHWLGRPHYGTLESMSRIERKHIAAYHKKNWVASRAVIGICGDVDPAAVKRLFNRALGDWKTGRDLGPVEEDYPKMKRRVAAYQAKRQQVHLFLGHLGVKIQDPDYPALVVMDHILGTGPGFTNRISRRLRDEEGLAYSVNANIHSSAGNMRGVFSAYIGTSPEHTGAALTGFMEEMKRIQDEVVPTPELDVARNYLIGSFALGFERAGSRAGYLIRQYRFGLDSDHLKTLPGRFSAVSAQDVQRAAQRHLFPDDAVLSSGGPIAKRALLVAMGAKARL